MIDRVLVPMDDSEMAQRALRYALEAHPDADITVLHVVGEPSGMMGKATQLALAEDIPEEARKLAKNIFETASEIASEYDRTVSTKIEFGHPVKDILDTAEEFDTVVVGTHGGSLADRLFMGSITTKVVRRSPVPVTVVR
jgi:nucleotide-binding universal stress UspA family protein